MSSKGVQFVKNSIDEILFELKKQGFSDLEIMEILKEALNISSRSAQKVVLRSRLDKTSDELLDMFLESDSEE